MIITTDFTSLKQSLYINHPTIALLDKEYFNNRESAQPFYDKLYESKILFYDPIECSKHINNINHDPLKWWLSHEVQKSKNIFLDQFARKSNNFTEELSFFINQLLKKYENKKSKYNN